MKSVTLWFISGSNISGDGLKTVESSDDLFFIVGQRVLVNGNDVHVGVALFFADVLQLRISFIDVGIQLQG